MTRAVRPRLATLFVTLAVLALALAATPLSAQGDAAPAQPTGLTTEAAHDAVQLRWDDPGDGGITHYQVLRRDRGVHKVGEFVTIEDNTGSAATTYTDHSVEPETRYVYRVQAVNAHGVSRWSSFARANTPAVPAPEPTPTPAPSPAPTPEPSPAPTPEPSPAPTPEPSPAPPAAPESTPAPTPEAETPPPSTEQVCELPAESQPTGAPTNVRIGLTGHFLFGYQGVVTWDPPGATDAVTTYQVAFYRLTADGAWRRESLLETAADSRTAAFVVDSGQQYDAAVCSGNGAEGFGRGRRAAEVLRAGWPTAPTGLSATEVAGAVELRWERPPGAAESGYRIVRQTHGLDETSSEVLVENTESVATGYTDATANADSCYSYTVQAINAYGLGAASAALRWPANCQAEPEAAPEAEDDALGLAAPNVSARWVPPTVVQAQGSDGPQGPRDVGAGTVVLTWTNPISGGSPTGYQVKRWVSGYDGGRPSYWTCDAADIGSGGCTSQTEYTDSELQASVTYRYAVRLVKRVEGEPALWSPWSATVTIDVPALTASYPPAPTGFSVSRRWDEAANGPVITLSWTAVPGATSYTLWRGGVSADGTVNVLAGGLTTTTYDDTTTKVPRTYEYRVQAHNDAGASPLSRSRFAYTHDLKPGVPGKVTDLNLTFAEESMQVTLTWTPPAEGPAPTRYEVFRLKLSAADVKAIETPGNGVFIFGHTGGTKTTSFTQTIEAGYYYKYAILSRNSAGFSKLSGGRAVNLIGEVQADPDTPGPPGEIEGAGLQSSRDG